MRFCGCKLPAGKDVCNGRVSSITCDDIKGSLASIKFRLFVISMAVADVRECSHVRVTICGQFDRVILPVTLVKLLKYC